MRLTPAVFVIIAVGAFYAFSLSIGDKAPQFTLTTANDSLVSFLPSQDQVRILCFICLGCGQERAAGSAVEKYLWQVYRNRNVQVIGIETSNITKNSAMLTAKLWGISFPVGVNGNKTASLYGTADCSIFLVDRENIVVSVVRVPWAPDTGDAVVDSIVKYIAEKIPALLAATISQPRMAAHHAVYSTTINDNLKWTGDLIGRRLDRTKAPQMVIDGAGGTGTLFLRKQVTSKKNCRPVQNTP